VAIPKLNAKPANSESRFGRVGALRPDLGEQAHQNASGQAPA
jgi:hypothetical protein